jgi:hypothetical protein
MPAFYPTADVGSTLMPILDPTQLPAPPPPLAPNVKTHQPDGTPTREFHTFLTQLNSWLTKLRELLTTGP